MNLVKQTTPDATPICKLAVVYLRKQRCRVIAREFATAAHGIADAIGWKGDHSILIECKRTKLDFAKDRLKFHRRESYCMGLTRYYLTPIGLLSSLPVEELAGWGLIETDGKKFKVIVPSPIHPQRNVREEIRMLYSMLIRHPDDPQRDRLTFTRTPMRDRENKMTDRELLLKRGWFVHSREKRGCFTHVYWQKNGVVKQQRHAARDERIAIRAEQASLNPPPDRVQ